MTENTAGTGAPLTGTMSEMVQYQSGAIVSRIVLKAEKGNVTLFAFDQGQGLSEHTAPFAALVQVLDGAAEVTVGGTPYHVAAGGMILMPANVPHALDARERFKMALTMIRA
jgi:quercetin dioxygenase-like cupin family protein